LKQDFHKNGAARMVFRTLSMKINKSSKNADFKICLGGLKSAVILKLLA